jgi:zinc protease
LVNFNITIQGGHSLDPLEKAGLASLMSDLMNEGTATKTPAELEEAIGLLGSSVYIGSGLEDIFISGNCLSRNFEKTMALVQEMLLQPRWDATEFARLQQELKTSLKGREANPTAIASMNFNKLVYGEDNIYAVPTNGTLETTKDISLDDVKSFYSNLSPKVASFNVVGNIDQGRVEKALASLSDEWKGDAITMPTHALPENLDAGTLYFIDVPNAKQSVLNIGKLAIPATHPDKRKLDFANEIIGGGSAGRLFQVLRIGKGYTYGAYSGTSNRLATAPFLIRSSVRANATEPSLTIIKDMVQNYGPDFTDEDVELTKNKIVKANTRAYESFGAKLNVLSNIHKYSKPLDYVNQ